jgi:Domain of unknown function (DUF4145)
MKNLEKFSTCRREDRLHCFGSQFKSCAANWARKGGVASLVRKGLSPVVQQALDAVRVIGNEAVHPETLDLKDDRDTATTLFGLVTSFQSR